VGEGNVINIYLHLYVGEGNVINISLNLYVGEGNVINISLNLYIVEEGNVEDSKEFMQKRKMLQYINCIYYPCCYKHKFPPYLIYTITYHLSI
jgi:hypothetical protein